MNVPLTLFFGQYLGIESEPLILIANTVVTTIVILIFGEFIPKTFFRLYANELLYFLAYPLRALQFLLFLPAWVMTKLTDFLLRFIFKSKEQDIETAFTRVDLEAFIKDTTHTNAEEKIDKELFEKALQFKNVKVKECMVPRTEIEHIDISCSVEELNQVFQRTKLSRIIVIDKDIEEVLGYVHHQQLLSKPKTIRELLVREIPFVPEAMRVQVVMNLLITKRINMACVVDEFGGTAGIITMEDILEEIFGEIEDEHDEEEYVETQVSENEYLFSGRLELDYLNEKYENLNFPEGEYHTLSGFIVMTTETIPKQGDIIELDGFKFVLELVSETKIETVRVLKLDLVDEKLVD